MSRLSKKTQNPKTQKRKSSGFFLKLLLSVSVVVIVALVYLDARVRYGLNERQWQLPARVYARALTLQVGQKLTVEDLQTELRLLGYSNSSDGRSPGTVKREGNAFWIYNRGYKSIDGPVKAQRFYLAIINNEIVSLELLGAGKDSLSKVTLEPLEIGSIYPKHREDRLLVRLEQVPRSLLEILVLIEDRRFQEHFGLSPRAIGRALLANIEAGHTVQGGSTITQQLVKNVFLSRDRSLWRKAVEAAMTLMVEIHYSKDEILESYINEVYLGQEGARSIHGFALASQHYFNRPLEELHTGQIALLVGMVKGPAYYDPWRHPQRTQQRRNVVLNVMAAHQLITPDQQLAFEERDLSLAKRSATEGVYPAYLDLVRRQLRRDYSEKALQTEGLKIYTAFDPIVQRHAEVSLAKVLKGKEKGIEGALVVTDVTRGDVVAVVGGRRMRYAGFNRALDAVRPIGSLMKPAIYLSALEQSHQYSLASRISDNPVEVVGQDGSLWQPRNFDRKNHGEVLLHRSLSQSYNVATARLGMELGLPNVLAMAQRLGVQRNLPAVPSVLLGAGELAPIEVAGMYQTIAASGIYSPLRSIVNIANSGGQALARYPVIQEVAVDERIMHLLHYSLLEVVREGTGQSAYKHLPADFAVAGKTGTTNDLRDSWFAGYAGDYLAVVWLGRDDNKTAGMTGSSGALKVWTEFINRASHIPLDFSVPPGVVYHWIDSASGDRSGEVCEGARYVPFLQGTAPTTYSACKTTIPSVWKWFKRLF